MQPVEKQAKAKVGRPARVSRPDIAEAALAIGLDKVSLQAIGSRLGVDHSSLYRHVAGRDDILNAAVDLAIGRIDWEQQASDWRTYLRNAAETVWDLCERHPGLADTIRQLDTTSPSLIRAFLMICRYLESFGFTPSDAVLIVDSVMDMTVESSSGWRRLASPSDSGGNIAGKIRQSWEDEARRASAEDTHLLLMQNVISDAPKDWWLRKLELLLNGADFMWIIRP